MKIKPTVTLKEIGAITISVILLSACLFVILSSGYEAAVRNWAFGVVGTILGVWVKR